MGYCVVLDGMLTAHPMLEGTLQAQLSRQGADSKQLCLGVAVSAAAFPAELACAHMILSLTKEVFAAERSRHGYCWGPPLV